MKKEGRGMKHSRRILAALLTATVVLAGCGGSGDQQAAGGGGGKIAVAYDLAGRGDGGFNDLAFFGVEQAAQELDLEVTEVTAKADDSDQDRIDRLRLLAESGHNPIVAVGFTYAGPVAEVAADFPDVWFGIVDDGTVEAPNVAGLVFAEHEGSFLVGVVAALKTQTGNVGFIGGVNIPLIQKFEAGFIAGVAAVDPNITVQTAYVTQPPDFGGFNDPAKGKEAAKGMYDAGADIIYAAAGGSGNGVFQAASEEGLLAIGVDADQYNTADAAVRDVIISSMLKNVNVATYTFAMAVADGSIAPGVTVFDLSRNGVGYSTTGGAIDDIAAQVDEWKERIISGQVVVPDSRG